MNGTYQKRLKLKKVCKNFLRNYECKQKWRNKRPRQTTTRRQSDSSAQACSCNCQLFPEPLQTVQFPLPPHFEHFDVLSVEVPITVPRPLHLVQFPEPPHPLHVAIIHSQFLRSKLATNVINQYISTMRLIEPPSVEHQRINNKYAAQDIMMCGGSTWPIALLHGPIPS